MTTREIAAELNKKQWYKKKDGSAITPYQIHGRTKNYSLLFLREGSMVHLRDNSRLIRGPQRNKAGGQTTKGQRTTAKKTQANGKDNTKYMRAAQAWDCLVEAARRKTTIQYNELARQMDLKHPRPLRHYLKIIQDYCLENRLPPLTILATDALGRTGQGFIAWDVDNIEEGKSTVYRFNWENLINPFSFAKSGLSIETIIKHLLTKPDDTQEVYAKVRVRGTAQIIFRKALLEAYNNRCAVCGVKTKCLLEACHIIPWAETKKADRLDIRNGILMCANHHRLFDNGYFSIDDSYSITQRKGGKKDEILNAPAKSRLILPKDKNLWPNAENLRLHQRKRMDDKEDG